MDNCPYCGTKLIDTTYGRKHCPNHGIIDESKEIEEVEEPPSYIN